LLEAKQAVDRIAAGRGLTGQRRRAYTGRRFGVDNVRSGSRRSLSAADPDARSEDCDAFHMIGASSTRGL
jgi:hypothetical protein